MQETQTLPYRKNISTVISFLLSPPLAPLAVPQSECPRPRRRVLTRRTHSRGTASARRWRTRTRTRRALRRRWRARGRGCLGLGEWMLDADEEAYDHAPARRALGRVGLGVERGAGGGGVCIDAAGVAGENSAAGAGAEGRTTHTSAAVNLFFLCKLPLRAIFGLEAVRVGVANDRNDGENEGTLGAPKYRLPKNAFDGERVWAECREERVDEDQRERRARTGGSPQTRRASPGGDERGESINEREEPEGGREAHAATGGRRSTQKRRGRAALPRRPRAPAPGRAGRGGLRGARSRTRMNLRKKARGSSSMRMRLRGNERRLEREKAKRTRVNIAIVATARIRGDGRARWGTDVHSYTGAILILGKSGRKKRCRIRRRERTRGDADCAAEAHGAAVRHGEDEGLAMRRLACSLRCKGKGDERGDAFRPRLVTLSAWMLLRRRMHWPCIARVGLVHVVGVGGPLLKDELSDPLLAVEGRTGHPEPNLTPHTRPSSGPDHQALSDKFNSIVHAKEGLAHLPRMRPVPSAQCTQSNPNATSLSLNSAPWKRAGSYIKILHSAAPVRGIAGQFPESTSEVEEEEEKEI
ncbi:hypothetical protein C8R44DRAFT_862612 [Mycena epipterygia]|nr:hypothetical protein C8R44DRAFT_862612 [Mycena epipterygia]